MHGSKQDLPVVLSTPEATSRQTEWGDLNVAIESFAAGVDPTPLFQGLPNDCCQCPHWGYVIKGKIRVKYADREETIVAGDAYYLAPGHIPMIEEDTEVVEFSPKGSYQETMQVVASNLDVRQLNFSKSP